jgi:hypothetical protein
MDGRVTLFFNAIGRRSDPSRPAGATAQAYHWAGWFGSGNSTGPERQLASETGPTGSSIFMAASRWSTMMEGFGGSPYAELSERGGYFLTRAAKGDYANGQAIDVRGGWDRQDLIALLAYAYARMGNCKARKC